MSASAVRAADVRKSYGKGTTAVALAGVTMEVTSREFAAG